MLARKLVMATFAGLAFFVIDGWAVSGEPAQRLGTESVGRVSAEQTAGPASEVAEPATEPDRPAAAAHPLDKDPQLLGWWTLDEPSGTVAADSSGHGRQARLEAGLSFDGASVPGITGKALQFDGNHRVVVPGFQGVLGRQPRTVSLWINTDTGRGELVSWGKRDIGQMWILCFIRGRVGVTPHGGYYYMANPVHDQKWHHVVAVMTGGDEPTLDNNARLYLDGKLAEIDKIGLLALWTIDTGSDQDVTIGKGFKGAIDEVRIYGRALSEDEVAALYQRRR